MKKILIIEDNEQNLYLLTFILEKNGYSVSQARDGFSGIEQAKDKIPDLILLHSAPRPGWIRGRPGIEEGSIPACCSDRGRHLICYDRRP